jgi:hypothetical protein
MCHHRWSQPCVDEAAVYGRSDDNDVKATPTATSATTTATTIPAAVATTALRLTLLDGALREILDPPDF